MHRFSRLAQAAVLATILTGCNLESKVPLFSDKDGRALPASYGLSFATYSIIDGAWKAEDDTVSFTPSGKHYIASDGNSQIAVIFVPLHEHWWVVQAREGDKLPYYSLAEAAPGEILVHPIACKPLREAGEFKDAITFEGDDCFVKEGTDALRLFEELSAKPDQATLKMVPRS